MKATVGTKHEDFLATVGHQVWQALIQRWPGLAICDKDSAAMVINGVLANGKVGKPAVTDVALYFAQIGCNASAEAFMDHYEANGWKVGKVPMRDWQAACRTWARNHALWNNTATKFPPRNGVASLGALQIQLKTVQDEIRDILYPGGTAYAQRPDGDKRVRYDQLLEQRDAIRNQINSFAR